MLSSTTFSPPDGPLPVSGAAASPVAERRTRLTEAVYALCVVAIGVLFLMTVV